jgi:methylamine dehydrogenase accessory protein MauD
VITLLLILHVVLWLLVTAVAFLLWGNLRVTGLLDWRVIQLEATTPSRIGRRGLKPGKNAPDFTLSCTRGDEVSLHDFTGRRVLLVFVQTHCGPCHEIVPELNRLVGRETDLQILAVSRADPEEARQWVRDVDAQFPVLVQRDWRVSKRYQVFATPFAFLIDRNGVVESKGIISRPIAHRNTISRIEPDHRRKTPTKPLGPTRRRVFHIPQGR